MNTDAHIPPAEPRNGSRCRKGRRVTGAVPSGPTRPVSHLQSRRRSPPREPGEGGGTHDQLQRRRETFDGTRNPSMIENMTRGVRTRRELRSVGRKKHTHTHKTGQQRTPGKHHANGERARLPPAAENETRVSAGPIRHGPRSPGARTRTWKIARLNSGSKSATTCERRNRSRKDVLRNLRTNDR